jgi:hypothetical protein
LIGYDIGGFSAVVGLCALSGVPLGFLLVRGSQFVNRSNPH